MNATGTIPIVMASSGDPLGTGIVETLAHPTGNITGLSAFGPEIQRKQLEVLREAIPQMIRIAFLFNMSNPVLQVQWKEAEPAARSLGFQPRLLDVRTIHDLESALDAAVRQRTRAVIVGNDALTQANRGHIIQELVAKRHLAAISREREFVDAGSQVTGLPRDKVRERDTSFSNVIGRGERAPRDRGWRWRHDDDNGHRRAGTADPDRGYHTEGQGPHGLWFSLSQGRSGTSGLRSLRGSVHGNGCA